MSLLTKFELPAGIKYLVSVISAFISVGFFLYGVMSAIPILTNANTPAYHLVYPMICFITGFIGTMVSSCKMDEYGYEWSYQD